MAQQNIYDNDKFFEAFKGLRADEINFNDLIDEYWLFLFCK